MIAAINRFRYMLNREGVHMNTEHRPVAVAIALPIRRRLL